MSSLSFVPPGCNGRLRGCGRGEGYCEVVTEEAAGVGKPERLKFIVEAIMMLCEVEVKEVIEMR